MDTTVQVGAGAGLIALFVFGGLAIVAGIVVLVVRSVRAERARIAALGAMALSHGWVFAEQGDQRWGQSFDVAPFGQGHAREVQACVSGSDRGRGFALFDYEYRTWRETQTTDANGNVRSTQQEETHHVRACALQTGLAGPRLSLSGEGFFTRLLDGMTGADIDFEDEQFNRRFRVTCTDPKFAYAVLTPQTMERLVQTQPGTLHWVNEHLVLVETGRWQVVEALARLETLHSLVDLVPPYLLTGSGSDAGSSEGRP